jgi:hypothetical protein
MSIQNQISDSTKQEYDYIVFNEQIEVIRNDKTEMYKIVVGNPISGEKSYQTKASWVKINDAGIACSSMQISEYNMHIGITDNGYIDLDIDVNE